MYAIEVCDDEFTKLALNLAFAGSLRIGELLGLTWDCVDISPEAIQEGRSYIYVNKELQRVSKEAVKELDGKDVLLIFPEESKRCKTVRILKTPKTDSSVRKIFLPKSVAMMLIDWKNSQKEIKEVLGKNIRIIGKSNSRLLGSRRERKIGIWRGELSCFSRKRRTTIFLVST